MTEEQRAVLFAACALVRMRHARFGTAHGSAHEQDVAALALDRAVAALLDAEDTARVLANPLCKMGG